MSWKVEYPVEDQVLSENNWMTDKANGKTYICLKEKA